MMPITPIGAEVFKSLSPLGRSMVSSTSPTGSGSFVMSLNASAMSRSRSSVRRRRSLSPSLMPDFSALSRSFALASRIFCMFSSASSASAAFKSTSFFSSEESPASLRDAAFALCPINKRSVIATSLSNCTPGNQPGRVPTNHMNYTAEAG